ncbi:glycosyltransferase [Cytobacillus firmus]|uniref:glycosyltransferase n=1 Tax=Cytobacillus firmus TaxID=1399 RepID=UPI0021864D6B|nr:glycosyltransferase [Cytobacillus firmus]URM31142.1 glycosyltransferase [Cytobacillus firmus]
MNIAFDRSYTLKNSKYRGIGRYCDNLISTIVKNYPGHFYFDFFPHQNDSEENLKAEVREFIKTNKIDIFLLTSPFEFFNIDMLDKTLYGNTKAAVILYDLIPLIYPNAYLNSPHLKERYLRILDFIKSCDIIFAISEHTKKDAVRLANINPDKIKVIYGGVDRQFRVVPKINKQGIMKKYKITKPYVLCTGGIDFRKNLNLLINSFATVNRKLAWGYQLVIVCAANEQEKQQLYNYAASKGINNNDIILTGYIPNMDLVLLYNLAEAFAFPSLYEGLGFPVLEAMACGLPVLTSNNSSLDEIASDAAYKVDPNNAVKISNGLMELLINKKLQNKLRRKGIIHSSRFNWNKTSNLVMQSLMSFPLKNNTEEKFLPNIVSAENDKSRKKVAVFSPLPPLESGISIYFKNILDELSKHYDISIFIDEGYIPEKNISHNKNINIYNHSTFEEKKNEYSHIIYQMGNSLYHAYMLPYMQKYKGVIILHDLNLHGLTNAITLAKGDKKGYLRILMDDYKRNEAFRIIRKVTSGSKDGRFEKIIVNKHFINNSKLIIVHNEHSKRILSKKGINNVEVLNLPTHLPSLIEKSNMEDKLVLSCFSHVSSNRNIEIIIKSARRLFERGFRKFHLNIIGKYDPQYLIKLKEMVSQFNLNDHVTFTGYVNDKIYSEYLANTDIGINIRFPTNGETSLTLLELLSYGKPVIVTNIDSFSEFPNDVLIKIPVKEGIEDVLFNNLLSLYNNKQKRLSLGENARNYIANYHSVSAYVNQIKKLLD